MRQQQPSASRQVPPSPQLSKGVAMPVTERSGARNLLDRRIDKSGSSESQSESKLDNSPSTTTVGTVDTNVLEEIFGPGCSTNSNESKNVPSVANLSKISSGNSPEGTEISESEMTSTPTMKREYQSSMSDDDMSPEEPSEENQKRCKRKRTRSERNLLARKAGSTSTPKASSSRSRLVTEGEEEVALDAEIDRVLEEKANKNNLTATNVKSIIRHVITNNMVQKMIMTSAMKKKTEVADAVGGSSDEECIVGPKMTRARAKELYLENKQISIWPNVYSPIKVQNKSETQILIHHDLPEDSSGDEEYIPKDHDFSELIHSDDDGSSVLSSHTSDLGSPAPSHPCHGIATRSSLQSDGASTSQAIFKTPPPKCGMKKNNQEESAVSRRTRSKFPLKDTNLEDLEKQLIAPDVTHDMYDWGTATDNEDYVDFLKDFFKPLEHQNNEIDDEADPEYNVMEDDEDLHDREELRMDRAVKVPKKELNELIAELFAPGIGDEMYDNDLVTSLTGMTPLANDSTFTEDPTLLDNILTVTSAKAMEQKADNDLLESLGSPLDKNDAKRTVQQVNGGNNETSVVIEVNCEGNAPHIVCRKAENEGIEGKNISDEPCGSTSDTPTISSEALRNLMSLTEEESPFTPEDFKYIHHQMRQHIQLLTQSYVLTFPSENSNLKSIAKGVKGMILELKNYARGKPPNSNFNVCNLDHAWNLVNFWPHKYLQQSPIKKKILEEKYISESGFSSDENGVNSNKGSHFPRHVVKVIVESPAFVYNNLLPECYPQHNKQIRCFFNIQEDILLVRVLDELKDKKLSVEQTADLASSLLLMAHTSAQVYHRIRNLRKSSGVQYCDPIIKKYFVEGIVPVTNRSYQEINDDSAKCLLERDREGVSKQWLCLLKTFEDSSTYHWEQNLKKAPVAGSIKKKWIKEKEKKRRFISRENQVEQLKPMDRVFPTGTYQIENTDPNTVAIPILNANGKPGAIIYVPKYATASAGSEVARRSDQHKQISEKEQTEQSPEISDQHRQISEKEQTEQSPEISEQHKQISEKEQTEQSPEISEQQKQISENEQSPEMLVQHEETSGSETNEELIELSYQHSPESDENEQSPEMSDRHKKTSEHVENDSKDAFMEAYLQKVSSRTEKNDPELYPMFIQTLMDAGRGIIDQIQLHEKVKILFKNYQCLLNEFECFLDPQPNLQDSVEVHP